MSLAETFLKLAEKASSAVRDSPNVKRALAMIPTDSLGTLEAQIQAGTFVVSSIVQKLISEEKKRREGLCQDCKKRPATHKIVTCSVFFNVCHECCKIVECPHAD